MVVQNIQFLAQQDSAPELLHLRCYMTDENTVDWMNKIDRDPVMPTHVLKRLSYSADADLRMAVADHANTALDVHLMLAEDENPDVRLALAENHNISRDVLKRLAEDSNPYVADLAMKTLSRLSLNDSENFSWRSCGAA